LPEFRLFNTVPGVHPETGEPCLLPQTNHHKLRARHIGPDDVLQFVDKDGTVMRVVETVDGEMKMRV
jgi:hypothetical protein